MNLQKKVSINLGDRSYSIYIGANTIESFVSDYINKNKPTSVCIVTNDMLKVKLSNLINTISTASNSSCIYYLPEGESNKTIDEWAKLLDFMLEKQLDRKTVVIAIGGGVVGDIAGFAASAYRRGVACVQVPTTLLAMVDSSVGGKTGVNHKLGKNLIGAFWQPGEVWIDIDALSTLPQREFLAGMAEIVKYAFIGGRDFFNWIDNNIDNLLKRDSQTLIEGIRMSCRFKGDVVEQDENESGLRAILNYGHTFGHAIEKVAGYGKLLHGEAVTYGMMAAAELALILGMVDEKFVERHNTLCRRLTPPDMPELSIDELLTAMMHDKKVQGNKLKIIVANDYGGVEIISGVDKEKINQAWETIIG